MSDLPNTDRTDAPPVPDLALDADERRQPYLKVFGPDIGVHEHALSGQGLLIGRAQEANIRLPHQAVRECHAILICAGGEYRIRDGGAGEGFLVNKQRRIEHKLRHGDTVQIGNYIIQYRTHRPLRGSERAVNQAKLLLRTEYALLPSAMRLRYRTLAVSTDEVFRTGDTLKVGHGGILVPTETPTDETVCLELQLSWPNGTARSFVGENMGTLEVENLHWLCVKLHTVPGERREQLVQRGTPGPWVDVLET
jgi:pSer/pThr/pTyr-binding forkhead associated (FHA) protein